ncbi:hypothetical protein SBA4_3200038 [Candidatus Sulfopaludibacter sp. SbA4]|nr:hypothetical protein SBA4_3200038 [Candidatus Sulfopaludibacter sp. SbA4]
MMLCACRKATPSPGCPLGRAPFGAASVSERFRIRIESRGGAAESGSLLNRVYSYHGARNTKFGGWETVVRL